MTARLTPAQKARIGGALEAATRVLVETLEAREEETGPVADRLCAALEDASRALVELAHAIAQLDEQKGGAA